MTAITGLMLGSMPSALLSAAGPNSVDTALVTLVVLLRVLLLILLPPLLLMLTVIPTTNAAAAAVAPLPNTVHCLLVIFILNCSYCLLGLLLLESARVHLDRLKGR